MRVGPAQLPDHQELLDILASEGKRSLAPEKESAHYGDFATIVELLRSYGLPTGFFEDSLQFDDLRDPALYGEISSMFADLSEAVVRDHGTDKLPLLNNLYDYLSEEDAVGPADIIFVFGSKETFRTEKAVELYKQGFAPTVVISGQGPFYEGKAVPEAERLGQFALENGVPQEALVLEKESITVPDNVKRSLNLLEEKGLPHRSIILVNSPFVQRRGWAHFNKFSAQGTKLIRCNSAVGERFAKDTWFNYPEVVKIITKEFFGLRISEMISTS